MAQEAGDAAVGAAAPGAVPANGAAASPPGSQMWIIIVAFAAIMYFLMIRPNQKRDKERREMLASVAKGDRVLTNGGMYGTVIGVTEQTVVLRISEDPPTKVEFVRGAIARIMRGEEKKK